MTFSRKPNSTTATTEAAPKSLNDMTWEESARLISFDSEALSAELADRKRDRIAPKGH